MTTQNRAKRGGQIGVNGEFYEGGKFLPSTERAKGKPVKRKARKVQVEPYIWVLAEDGKTPLFQMVGAQAAYIDRYNPAAGIAPFAAGLAMYGQEFCGRTVADQCERYNRGERWA